MNECDRADFSITVTVGNFKPLKPSGHYTPPGLTFTKSTFCPTKYIDVFCMGLRTNSDYFPLQH
jgi:hypothetical protein